MNQHNIDIKFQEHYKLYVLLKDKIIFESELEKNNIKYYIDLETQAIDDNSIRYFLLDKDRKAVDDILTANEMIASTETISNLDYRDGKKYYKVYLIIALIVILILFFADFISSSSKWYSR